MDTNNFIRIVKKHNYNTSTDYKLLFDVMQSEAVVCFLDYGEDCRDIAATIYTDYPSYEISVRGHCYIHAYNEHDFIKQCKNRNVEFLLAQ